MNLSLTTRLLVFFQGTLALVLAGFSVSLYLLAQSYLSHQVDERLASALATLDALVDRDELGLEWEAKDRRLALGENRAADQVRWLVRDDRARRAGASANVIGDDQLAEVLFTFGTDYAAPRDVGVDGKTWRFARRRLDDTKGGGQPLPNDRYQTLYLTTAASLEPMQTLLRNLAGTLVGLSLAVWVLAAGGGYLLCRRALGPVTRMATVARGINAAALDQRLPAPATGDELADLGGAFNDLLARLQESFERQRRFTGDASHQLRTPLAAMLGQVEVALRRPRPPEEYARVLGLVGQQAEHLRQIVEMLLFLARADAESKRPQLDRIDLTAWLRDHARTWSGHARAADLRVECPADVPLWVDAQPPLLGQLVDNVWDNACKYSEPGTPLVLRVAAGADGVCLSLEDCGCGVAADELPHVFEPFYRSPRSLPTAGVGLGLAVVQRIAAALSGTATFQSEVGRGSIFRLCLPPAESDELRSRPICSTFWGEPGA